MITILRINSSLISFLTNVIFGNYLNPIALIQVRQETLISTQDPDEMLQAAVFYKAKIKNLFSDRNT